MREREMNQSIDVGIGRGRTTITPFAPPAEFSVQPIIKKFMDNEFVLLRSLKSSMLGQKQSVPSPMFPGKD